MRSPLGTLLDRAPIPHTGRTPAFKSGPFAHRRGGTEAQLAAMGSVGTLFAIVDREANETARVDWHLYRKAASGKEEDRVEVTRHAALDIWHKPNPFFHRQELVETVQQHIDLVGEGWLVITRSPLARSIPLEIWPVRPDRMRPVPHRTKFLAGYVYTGPDGEEVPLELDEVIFIRRPNPLDMYRGIGPVQAILTDLDSAKFSAEWNRNFFINSALPGGIVEVDKRLSDDEWEEMVKRWREQHQGVAQAHRVAILEHGGKWVDRKFSMRDMQFAELRGVQREIIREAFAFPKGELGTVDDVNRANAEAGALTLARGHTVPRLERWDQALNNDFLPMFGRTATGLEFDYESPVPEDREADDRERESKANAYKILTDARVHPEDAADVVGLPQMRVVSAPEPEPPEPTEPTEPSEPGEPGEDAVARLLHRIFDHHHEHVRGQGAPAELPEEDLPDLAPVQEQWQAALDDLVQAWRGIRQQQTNALVAQVREAILAGDLDALTRLDPSVDDAAERLLAAMTQLARLSAQQAVIEAAEQDVDIAAGTPDEQHLAAVATVVASLLAGEDATSAANEALRLATPGLTTDEEAERVANGVRAHLDSLTDARPRDRLGHALTQAQHAGRVATMQAAEEQARQDAAEGLTPPSVAYYGQEKNDTNTCLAPDVRVTTREGAVYAKDVTLDDELLTHAGRWVRPSAIVVSDVEEKLARIRLADGRSLRLTADHPVLVFTGDGFAWRGAGELAGGDLVVDQSAYEVGVEAGGPDVVLGETPDDVPTVGQVGGLPPVDVGPEGVPVGAVGLDDESVPEEEVDDPRADLSLSAVYVPELFEGLADGPLDGGLGVAGAVAAQRAVAGGGGLRGDDTEFSAAVVARDGDGRASARLRAVATGLGSRAPEGGTAAPTYGVAATVGNAAGARAVGVPVRGSDGDAELGVAAGAPLRDAVSPSSDLGAEIGVGELALVRAVDSAGGMPPRDRLSARLASRRRVVRSATSPSGTHGTRLAQRPPLDRAPALRTRFIHNVIVLVEVTAVEAEPYVGEVFDFTIPGDETFWAEGVLVHNCRFCREVDGRWLGNSIEAALAEYPAGGYIRCEGRQRCRGMVVSVYRPEQVGGGGE